MGACNFAGWVAKLVWVEKVNSFASIVEQERNPKSKKLKPNHKRERWRCEMKWVCMYIYKRGKKDVRESGSGLGDKHKRRIFYV